MEQFHDYRMVENRPVVEQAHEIQALVKELELFGCVLPDKFVAGCMIAKLTQSWTDFAILLKHKRQEFSTAELVGTLDHYYRIGLCSRPFIPIIFGPGTKNGFCPGSNG